MATVHPPNPPDPCSAGELRVRRALGEDLPEEWHVFHQVAWQSLRDGREGDGEADFVLLHPEVGLLVLEVKGGGIDVVDGRWLSTDRHDEVHGIKSPFQQACSSKHALYRYLSEHLEAPPIGHAVCFPNLSLRPEMGPEAPPEITWMAPDLLDVEGAAARTAAHWGMHARMPRDRVLRIVNLLAPSLSARPLLRDQVREAGEELMRLTERQVRTLQQMRRNRRAVVYGGAGTGKSVLARERARRLADEGFRVLLTCFNRPLADHLKRELGSDDRVVVRNFHSLLPLEIPAEPPPDWWVDTYPDLLVEAAAEAGFAVDAVVVDEGQDFAPSWFSALQLLMSDSAGPFYVFADPRQNLYRPAWEPPFDGPYLELLENCRSTRPLAAFAAALGGSEAPEGGPPGPPPEVVEVGEDPLPAVGKVLNRLVKTEGLAPTSITVLCDRKTTLQRLREERPAGHVLGAPGEESLVAETVHRYKGLENDAVILCLRHLRDDRERALAYIGASRARTFLVVVAAADVLAALQPALEAATD